MGWTDKIKSLFGKKEPVKEGFKHEGLLLEQYESPNPKDFETPQKESPDLLDKTKQFVEGTVEEVKEQGSALWTEVKKQADKLDESTKPLRDAIQKKATETMDRVEDFIEETYQKALASEEEDKKKSLDQDGDGYADKPIDFNASNRDKTDHFLNKAKEWLDQKEPSQTLNKDKVIEPLELPKEISDEGGNANMEQLK